MYTERTPEQLDTVRRYVETLIARVEGWANGGGDQGYRPTLNRFCSWCDFRDKCPAYLGALEVGNVEAITPGLIDDVVVERQRLAQVEKLAKSRRYELDQVLKDVVNEEGPQAAGGMLVDVRPTTSRTYPPAATAEALAPLLGVEPLEALGRVASVDKVKLRKVIATAMEHDENAAIQVQVALDVMAKARTTSRLSVREDKGGR